MKRVIIIDDVDQQDVIEKLQSIAKKDRLSAEFLQFNVGSSFERDLMTNNQIDIQKVKLVFEERFKNKKIDLICFDYNLSDPKITGIDLLQCIKPLRKNISALVYSGELEFILKDILNKHNQKDLKSKQEAISKLKSLIRPGIEGFVDRTNYDDEIIKILKKKEETLDGIFEEKLAEYGDFSIDLYEELEISSVRQMLDNSDERAMKLKREIVEQFVAYIIKLKSHEE